MQLDPVYVVLVEASPRRTSDGVVQSLRLAGGGAVAPYRYFSNDWQAGLVALPTISALLGFGESGWGQGAVPQVTTLEWAPAVSIATAAGYFWKDADVTVRIGPDGGADGSFSTLLTGKAVAGEAIADGALRLTLADPAAYLYRPILTDRFTGTGGIEGDAAAANRIKRRSWGRCFNVEGRLLLAAYNIYEFGHPSYPWQEFTTIRDKGAAAGSLTTVAWAGSVAATLTALQAAAPPAGGAAVAPSIACVKWWTQPAGALTADIKGEVGSGYVETVPAIAERIVAARSSIGFVSGNVAAMAALRTGAAGWHVDSESMTVVQALDGLLGGVSLLWILEPAGTIRMREWKWDASVASLTSHQVSRGAVHAAHKARTLGYQANERVMSPGEIAAVALSVGGNDLVAGVPARFSQSGVIFREDFSYASTPEFLENWVEAAGASAEISIVADSSSGSSSLEIGNSVGNDQGWYALKYNLLFDPTKIYEFEVVLSNEAGGASVLLGFVGIREDGTTVTNETGAATYGGQHYVVNGFTMIADGIYKTLRGYVFGRSAGNAVLPANGAIATMNMPVKAQANVFYMRPVFLVNYPNATGRARIDHIQIREVQTFERTGGREIRADVGVDLDQGSGVLRRLTRGLSYGVARDGVPVTLSPSWDGTELYEVIFGGGGLVYHTGLAAPLEQQFQADNKSSTGFTPRLKLRSLAGSVTAVAETYAAQGSVGTAPRAFEINKGNANAAADNNYTLQFDIQISNGFFDFGGGSSYFAGEAVIGFWYRTGGVWVRASTKTFTGGSGGPTTTLTNLAEVLAISGLAQNDDFGVSIESSTFGATITAFDQVSYQYATGAGSTLTATPTIGAPIPFILIGGAEGGAL